MTDEEKKEISVEELDEVAGGKYGKMILLDDEKNNEQWLIENGKRTKTPEYCCPRCMSRNVINYNPGNLYVMRVKCNDCGYFGERGSISETSI